MQSTSDIDIRDGDTVLVHSMDRLARNLDDLRRPGQRSSNGSSPPAATAPTHALSGARYNAYRIKKPTNTGTHHREPPTIMLARLA